MSALVSLELPDVGEGLDRAEIMAWLVEVGDHVERDQSVVEIQTDKSLVELPAPTGGVVESLEVSEGDVVPVGQVLLTIRAGDQEAKFHSGTTAQPAAEPEPKRPDREPTQSAPRGNRPIRRPMAAPSTRRVARELQVDLNEVSGSGPGGRITRVDVEEAAAAEKPARRARPAQNIAPSSTRESTVVQLRGIRRRISETMTIAWQQIPHITDLREVDASGLVSAHRTIADEFDMRGLRLTYLPLVIAIVARALREHSALNASIDVDAGEITYHGRCNIGIATATDRGLIVPVIHDADERSIAEIAREVEALAEAARTGSVSPEKLTGGTFTVSNSGSYGSMLGTPIIRPPEVAILGVGRIHDAVLAVDGAPVVRPVLPMSVSADHRLIDGDVLGAFVSTLQRLVADPILLLAEGQ